MRVLVFLQQTILICTTMNLVTCTKEEFIAAFRKAKQQKREREKLLQREWAELQKRAAVEVVNGGNLQK